MRRTLALLTAAALALAPMSAGCKRKPAPAADAAPAPVVTDAATDLLFTWIDDKGEFHVETSASSVPGAARGFVRVRDPSKDAPPDRAFVVDLRTKQADGTYPVRAISRAEFEDVAVERRKAHGSVLAEKPPGAPSGSASGASAADPNGAPAVIIYGASWCGPCHQAASYCEAHHVPFVMKDIEKDGSAEREMHAKLAKAGRPGGSIPVLDVRGTILVGFSPAALEAALARR